MTWLLLLMLMGDSPSGVTVSAAQLAYDHLRAGNLDEAVTAFRFAVDAAPGQASLRKDLAYALLRTGEREEALRQFQAALKSDPQDRTAALECAYLYYETGRVAEARRIFQSLGENEPFQAVDGPLREGIARWQEALRRAPGQWSAHEELARLAEQRDELALAAAHYEAAWRLRPGKSELLLDLARVWQAQGDAGKRRAALATAWKHGSPRVAESAREILGGEVPGVEETVLAAAEPRAAPPDEPLVSAREMGERSLAGSYLVDAYRYFSQAHQDDPSDAVAVYKLGVAANLLGKDREAAGWFNRARRMGGAPAEAGAAYRRLRAQTAAFGITAWAVPYFSSRWKDAFLYGQVRGDWRLRRAPVTAYVSLRVVADAKGSGKGQGMSLPGSLSENSAIAGVGLNVRLHRTMFGWAEAGESFSLAGRTSAARTRPDYRGGVAWFRGWGALLGGRRSGWFAESNADGVFASRFGNDLLLYSQSRTGYTWRPGETGFQAQALLNWNATLDRNGEWWGNLAEAGPGLRLRVPGMPAGMSLRADFLQGLHLRQRSSPQGPKYSDLRLGVWYAFVY
ncbi:MAG: tetratricopeptide repeat protein [Acidobacteria bacterium]|nr:tetratricopeptide repeat protein [Acidobacteriota bacterium]